MRDLLVLELYKFDEDESVYADPYGRHKGLRDN